MKLLFLNTNIGYGGASKMLVWVANQCANVGHNVTLLTYRDSSNHQILHEKVKHLHHQLEDINGKGNVFASICWLHKYIKKEKFNLAIAFLSPSQLRLFFACLGTNTKTLFSQRGDPYSNFTGLKVEIINRLNNWTFTHADKLVFQTDQAMRYYGSSIQHKSVVIPNPIKPLIRNKVRDGFIDKRIVHIGRLDIFQKRQDLLIDAFKGICKNYPDFVLEFYGDGSDENKLRNLAADCPQIRFMGKTSNVAEVIQDAAIFVLSSDFEGIPNALLEAMSLGLPCISTDCSPGGAALLIKNKKNGMLTKRGDKDDLANAIRYFLDNPQISEEMGKEAQKVTDTFSEDKIKKLWLNIIEH